MPPDQTPGYGTHQPFEDGSGGTWCEVEEVPWPCDSAGAHADGVAAGRKQAAAEALQTIAAEVVGVSAVLVDDYEVLRFGAIRRALTGGSEPNAG